MTNPVFTQKEYNKVLKNAPHAEPYGTLPRKKKLSDAIWNWIPPYLPQPGKYDELQSTSRELMGGASDMFEGFKLDISKGLSENMSCMHSFTMSNDQNVQKYSFALQGVPNPVTMVMGRIDSDWNVMGKWQHSVSPRLLWRLSGQASREAQNSGGGFEVEYGGWDWYGTFQWNTPGLYRATYCQSLTQALAAGGELAYHHKQGMSVMTGAMRYEIRNGGIISALAALPNALQLSYFQEINPRLEFAVEWLASMSQGFDSKLDFAYSARFRGGEVRVHVDSNYVGHSGFSYNVAEEGPLVNFFAELDLKKKKYGFGIGVQMEM